MPWPTPCPAPCSLTDSLCFTLHTDRGAVPRRGSCPGHSQDARHLKGGWKRTGGTEEHLRNSPSQAGMPSLAYRPVFLRFPKGFLCIHVSYPSSCLPSLHVVGDTDSLSAFSSLKKRKEILRV